MKPTTRRCSTSARRAPPHGARDRSRADLLLWHQVFRRDGRHRAAAKGKRCRCTWAATALACRRLLGAIIEASHDDKGIIWPEGVTPFHAGIVNLQAGRSRPDAACEALYQQLIALGLDPLYDDRDERAGAKFGTMDLIGLPWRITIGPRGLKNGVVEVTSRRTGESEEMSPADAIAKIAAIYADI